MSVYSNHLFGDFEEWLASGMLNIYSEHNIYICYVIRMYHLKDNSLSFLCALLPSNVHS